MTTQINQNLYLELQSLGLTTNEAKVYLSTLELGPTSIWEISKKSGIKRPTCYDILLTLSVKGFASSTNDGKRIIYSVVSPKQLMLIEERRHNRVLKTFTQLEALASTDQQKPSIREFAGKKGIEDALNLLFLEPKNSEILVFGSPVFFAGENYHQEFIANRIKNNISERLLYQDTKEHREILERNNKKELRQVRFLSVDQFNMDTIEVCVFGDTIAHTAPGESEPYALVIKSGAFAKSERQHFEMLWQVAKN